MAARLTAMRPAARVTSPARLSMQPLLNTWPRLQEQRAALLQHSYDERDQPLDATPDKHSR